ncbi:hypothetical protein DH86_00003247 [Scytalidium sp. 3C]|nr:hypothetical protein DH86_00003247 [Scytalidium sp. 3C]
MGRCWLQTQSCQPPGHPARFRRFRESIERILQVG